MLWLKALGTDAVIVPGADSIEPSHEFQFPAKLSGLLPVLNDDQHGTVIYGVPRVHPGIARVVDREAISSLAKIQGGDDVVGLTKYVGVVENPAQNTASLTWLGFDHAEIEAKTDQGQSVLVEETWDPAWHAYENGKQLPVRLEGTMGFTLIDAPEGDHKILMRFETPLENRAGQVIFVLTGIVMIGLIMPGLLMSLRAKMISSK